MHPESDFKLAINQKNDNDITIFQYKVIVILFNVVLFLLSSLVTGPSFISISALFLELWRFAFYIDQKPRNRKYPRLCFGMDASNKMLLNAAKCQRYIFYRFWVINGKPTGGRGRGKIIPHPPPPRLYIIPPTKHCIIISVTLYLIINFQNNLKRQIKLRFLKKDEKFLKTNYRPVSILPTVSKIYEQCLYDQINEYSQNYFVVSVRDIVRNIAYWF